MYDIEKDGESTVFSCGACSAQKGVLVRLFIPKNCWNVKKTQIEKFFDTHESCGVSQEYKNLTKKINSPEAKQASKMALQIIDQGMPSEEVIKQVREFFQETSPTSTPNGSDSEPPTPEDPKNIIEYVMNLFDVPEYRTQTTVFDLSDDLYPKTVVGVDLFFKNTLEMKLEGYNHFDAFMEKGKKHFGRDLMAQRWKARWFKEF